MVVLVASRTMFLLRRGANGVGTNGVTAFVDCFLIEGLCGYSREPNCIFPKVPGHTFSPQSAKIMDNVPSRS